MSRNLAFFVGYAVILFLSTAASVAAADFGTAEEAKAMLERAVAAVKEDQRLVGRRGWQPGAIEELRAVAQTHGVLAGRSD